MPNQSRLANAQYVCGGPQCAAIFKTFGDWKNHSRKRHGACSNGIPISAFLETLRQEGLQSPLAIRFKKQWQRRKYLPAWERVFSVVPYVESQQDQRAETRGTETGSVNNQMDHTMDTGPTHQPQGEPEHIRRNETPTEGTDAMFIDNPFGVQEPRPMSAEPSLRTQSPPCEPELRTPSPEPSTEPPRLFNPLRDGGLARYTRHVTDKYIIYKHATAGAIIPKAPGESMNRWRCLRVVNKEKYNGSLWGIWGSEREWGDVKWCATAQVSRGKLEELVQTPRYRNDPPSFRTIDNLFKIIEDQLKDYGGPDWHTAGVRLPEAHLDESTLYYRCPSQCGDALFGMARFAGKISVGPELMYELDDETQVYGNMCSGNDWDRVQGTLPPGTTRGAVIFMSDATILSKYTGGVQVHALYMSLGNIDKEVREDISKGAWMLVGYIPKSGFEKTMARMGHLPKSQKTTLVNLLNRRLFHRCLDIITRPFRRTEPHEVMDPEGNVRSVLYDLAVYGADLEEQCMIATTERNSCPHCISKGEALGSVECQCPRSSEQIMGNIKKVLTNFHRAHHRHPEPLEFLKRAKDFGLNGVHKPFWRNLRNFDICKVLSPDLLHGYHKCFYDHIHKWNLTGLGADEYDVRLMAQIPTPGERMFPTGVSKLSQLSGKDYRALERVHVPLVAHSPGDDEGGVGSGRLTRATRAFLDYLFLAQYPLHTEKTLADYKAAYEEFHRHKQVWVKNKSKRMIGKGKKIRVNESWAIPKPHIARHAPEHIQAKGTLDNYNTETMEHLHPSHCKDPYGFTNHHKGWQKQVLQRLRRQEKIRDYGEWLIWHQEETRWEQEQEAMELDQVETQDDGEEGESESESEDSADEQEAEAENEQGEGLDMSLNLGEREGGQRRIEENAAGELVPSPLRSQIRGASAQETTPELLQSRSGAGHAEPNQHVSTLLDLKFSVPPGPSAIQLSHRQLTWQPLQVRVIGSGQTQAQFTRRPSSLLTSAETYAIKKRPDFSAVNIERLLRVVDVPNFLHDIAEHPYFASLPGSTRIDTLTELNFWDSYQVRIPTSQFAPEPRIARIYAVSGLLDHRGRSPKPGSKPRSDAVFYLPRDDKAFNHEEAKLHGMNPDSPTTAAVTPNGDNSTPNPADGPVNGLHNSLILGLVNDPVDDPVTESPYMHMTFGMHDDTFGQGSTSDPDDDPSANYVADLADLGEYSGPLSGAIPGPDQNTLIQQIQHEIATNPGWTATPPGGTFTEITIPAPATVEAAEAVNDTDSQTANVTAHIQNPVASYMRSVFFSIFQFFV
ncbi:hypothetical protein FRC11_000087 [Ceratobasidium sp. 423]|nr:hypothetical protein FRC11_000087 [Ceratobasidium sp. 423]